MSTIAVSSETLSRLMEIKADKRKKGEIATYDAILRELIDLYVKNNEKEGGKR